MHEPPVNDPMSSHTTAPLGSMTSGRLVFTSGAAGVTLHADPALPELYRAHFARHMPIVRVQGGTVTVHYRRIPFLDWLTYAREPLAAVTLNGSVPWELEFHGGVSKLTADLRRLQLRSLDVIGGASDVTVTLPIPTATVFVHVAGGVSHLTFRRPAGIAVRIHLSDSASGLTLDEQHVSAVTDGMRWQTQDYEHATDRYDISIGGGASNLRLAIW